MGLLEDCALHFKTDDLYDLFEVPKNVKDANLKKAYYKLSLKVHPDKAEEEKKDEANRLFQIVAKAYCILSDKEKRAIYDEQGIVDDEDMGLNKTTDWQGYWRTLFPKVTEAEIDNYFKKYKGSKEEEEDIKKYYERFDGDLLKMYAFLPGSSMEEEPRYIEIIRNLINSGDLEDYPAFHRRETKKGLAKRTKKAAKEAKEAEQAQKELGIGGNSDLMKAITGRQSERSADFNSFIGDLEAKYCKPKASKRGKKK